MTVFACNSLIASSSRKLLQHVAYYMRNGLLAPVCLKWCTRDANCLPIEMIISSLHMRYHMKAHEDLRLTMKTM